MKNLVRSAELTPTRLIIATAISFLLHIYLVNILRSDDANNIASYVNSSESSSVQLNLFEKLVSNSEVKQNLVEKGVLSKASSTKTTKSLNSNDIPVTTKVSLKGQRVPPSYPKRSLMLGEEGLVLVNVLIDEEGRQKSVEIVKSSNHLLLDNAAVAAIKKWNFNPNLIGGSAITSWVQIPVEFRIN